MKPAHHLKSVSPDDAATVAAIAAWPGDRPALVRLMECHIFHRAEWEYLGSRQDDTHWPVDAYRCGRCDRAWEKVS